MNIHVSIGHCLSKHCAKPIIILTAIKDPEMTKHEKINEYTVSLAFFITFCMTGHPYLANTSSSCIKLI